MKHTLNKLNKMMIGFSLTIALVVGGLTPAAHAGSVSTQFIGAALLPFGDLINWKVGDTSTYNVGFAGLGNIGTMVKSVTKDEGTAIWIRQDMNLAIQKQNVEALINKEDGKVLKLLVNGKEQALPDDKVEVISQDYTEITVPAGTFKVLHIVAKTKDAPKLEIWANPRDIVMEGTAKQTIQSQMGEITMELVSQKRSE